MEIIISLYRDHPMFLAAIVGILGLVVGSFLGVVATRIPKGESIVRPPSSCDHCRQRLRPLDLVPVIGYQLLRGRCRHCRAKVLAVYPLLELTTGGLFALVAWQIGFRLELLIGLLLVSILVVITLTDIQQRLIPDRVVFFGMGALLVLRIFTHPLPWWNYLLAFIIGGGILYVIALLSLILLRKEGMGGGDIKLFAMLGLALGVGATLLTLFLAATLGVIGGLIQRWLTARKRKSRQDRQRKGHAQAGSYAFASDDSTIAPPYTANTPLHDIPEEYIAFGPYIAAAAIISYIWGEGMISVYLSFVLY